MSHAPQLHPKDQHSLFQLHKMFKKSACRTSCSTAVVSFLVIGALIVIGAACLCLILPGVNVINNVIFPGVLPGSGALLLSIPFIVYSIRKSREKNAERRELIDWNIMLLNYYQVEQMEERVAISFIQTNFFKPKWMKEYSSKVISDCEERLKKKALCEVLDKARTQILEKH